MVGPKGVGKTENARRLAKLVGPPFIRLEATQVTAVEYVGRDVESVIGDLTETAIRMVKTEKLDNVKDQARELANERLLEILIPGKKSTSSLKNPFEVLFQQGQTKE